MWLPWNHAAVLALLALAVAGCARGWLRATSQELALVLVLYSLWRLAGELADRHADGAVENARALFRFQQWLHLPNELTVQQQVLDHPLVVQALNGYYAGAHVPGVVLVLVWLFFRHRDRYSWVRNALALITAACLVLHFIPLAPPRLVPDLGFVDTGVLYEQSVYGSVGAHGLSNQVAAIPSVHMAWALLVAWGVLAATRSRWRWLVVAHPVLTLWSIVATGNHWWLDAVSAAALLAIAVLVVTRLAALGEVHRQRGAVVREHRVAAGDGEDRLGHRVGGRVDRDHAPGPGPQEPLHRVRRRVGHEGQESRIAAPTSGGLDVGDDHDVGLHGAGIVTGEIDPRIVERAPEPSS